MKYCGQTIPQRLYSVFLLNTCRQHYSTSVEGNIQIASLLLLLLFFPKTKKKLNSWMKPPVCESSGGFWEKGDTWHRSFETGSWRRLLLKPLNVPPTWNPALYSSSPHTHTYTQKKTPTHKQSSYCITHNIHTTNTQKTCFKHQVKKIIILVISNPKKMWTS